MLREVVKAAPSFIPWSRLQQRARSEDDRRFDSGAYRTQSSLPVWQGKGRMRRPPPTAPSLTGRCRCFSDAHSARPPWRWRSRQHPAVLLPRVRRPRCRRRSALRLRCKARNRAQRAGRAQLRHPRAESRQPSLRDQPVRRALIDRTGNPGQAQVPRPRSRSARRPGRCRRSGENRQGVGRRR